jgi:hypothetical protein
MSNEEGLRLGSLGRIRIGRVGKDRLPALVDQERADLVAVDCAAEVKEDEQRDEAP